MRSARVILLGLAFVVPLSPTPAGEPSSDLRCADLVGRRTIDIARTIDLGDVTAHAAVRGREILTIALELCSGDRLPDVVIDSSPRDADELASFTFAGCDRRAAVGSVEIEFTSTAPATWIGRDPAGQTIVRVETEPRRSAQTVVIEGGGIASVAVIGEGLCVSSICYRCVPETPEDDRCVETSSVLVAPGQHDSVLLHPAGIVAFAPWHTDGTIVPLDSLDTDTDGDFELFIGVSQAESPEHDARPAHFAFRPICAGEQPTSVTFRFRQGGPQATWTAYDVGGAVLDTAHSAVSGSEQEITLSADGIFDIRVVGIRLAIESICWSCEPIEPADDRCVETSSVLVAPGQHDSVLLHPAGIVAFAPWHTDGTIVPLDSLDTDTDGDYELFIGVSQAEAPEHDARPAHFAFRPICAGEQPTSVTFRFRQGGLDATWTAYDVGGAVLDTAHSAVSGSEQEITLSGDGIFDIRVIGIRLAIESICWGCEPIVDGPRRFIRGDADGSASVELTDAIRILSYLFLGAAEPACEDAADADDSGNLTIGDPTVILNFLFLGGPAPAGGLDCRFDLTRDELTCESPSCGA